MVYKFRTISIGLPRCESESMLVAVLVAEDMRDSILVLRSLFLSLEIR